MKCEENLSILENSLAEKRYFNYITTREPKRSLYSTRERVNMLVKGGI